MYLVKGILDLFSIGDACNVAQLNVGEGALNNANGNGVILLLYLSVATVFGLSDSLFDIFPHTAPL